MHKIHKTLYLVEKEKSRRRETPLFESFDTQLILNISAFRRSSPNSFSLGLSQWGFYCLIKINWIKPSTHK